MGIEVQLHQTGGLSAIAQAQAAQKVAAEEKANPPPAGSEDLIEAPRASTDRAAKIKGAGLTGATASAAAEIDTLLAGSLDRKAERTILDKLTAATATELNGLLSAIDLEAFFDHFSDHFPFGPRNRSAAMRLLGRERLPEISVANRERMISAMQDDHTDRKDERCIRDIFLGTHGAQLTELKNAIDAGGDYHDLAALIYRDIDRAGLRNEILTHIATQAAALKKTELKVLSDIDDTFKRWRDESYPSDAVYPGVRQFYTELDRGPSLGRLGDMVFLTARPGDRPGIIETKTIEMLKQNGVDATVLNGDVPSLLSSAQMGEKKVENFHRYQALYPEYDFVFIGDSGQGDVLAGEAMLRLKPNDVRCIFIHDVTHTSAEQRAAYAKRNIVFFDNYVEAACEAFKRGLIGAPGLLNVATTAESDFQKITFTSSEQRTAREQELARACAQARALAKGG